MICVECDSTTNEHYTYPDKLTGIRIPFSKCKKCHNPPKVKQPVGFKKLPADVQERIRESLKDRKNKIKTIAEEEGLVYETLRRWVAKGLV